MDLTIVVRQSTRGPKKDVTVVPPERAESAILGQERR
jgi:hypothetical protein